MKREAERTKTNRNVFIYISLIMIIIIGLFVSYSYFNDSSNDNSRVAQYNQCITNKILSLNNSELIRYDHNYNNCLNSYAKKITQKLISFPIPIFLNFLTDKLSEFLAKEKECFQELTSITNELIRKEHLEISNNCFDKIYGVYYDDYENKKILEIQDKLHQDLLNRKQLNSKTAPEASEVPQTGKD